MGRHVAFPLSLSIILLNASSEVTVKAVTELDNKATHGYPLVLKWHRPFL
ncbi:hypothetical protein O5290_16630 [Escherichia coli]|nr:hypothetical protein [Escherichia coli]